MKPANKLDLSLIGLNRRSFLRRAGLISALSPMAAMLLGGNYDAKAAPLPEGLELDLAILNFALNLEYLEAEYYTFGTTGDSIAAQGVTITGGQGTQGDVTIKASPKVPFATPALFQFASEIAADERGHIKFIQSTIQALGGTFVSQPSIDLLNSFNTVAQAAGIANSFDPFENETNFFLGGYSLTDVGVTAYHGAAPLITTKAVLAGSAAILAAESYHDSTLRLGIYQAGATAQDQARKVSALRDTLDDQGKSDKDQGVVNEDGSANIVPTDKNSIIFARTPRQVLNIVYGGFKKASGGFFPAGVNGTIK